MRAVWQPDDVQVSKAAPPHLRLDPELAAITVLMPVFDLTDPPGARLLESALVAQGRNPLSGVSVEDEVIARRDGGELSLRVYRPSMSGQLPAILYIHGGGFLLGSVATEDDRCEFYARDAECVVVAIDYRLAPEHPYPAAFEDCVDALRWLRSESQRLGVDARRIAVGGNSAGGALAAAVALESRAPDLPTIVHQLLINPVLDHRSQTPSMHAFPSIPGWNRDFNLVMWQTYLSGAVEVIDHRASPSLASDLTGAPGASFWIAEYDALRDEGYEYAGRLMAAGVSVGVIQYPGTIHGFDSYRMTSVGQRALNDQVIALRRAFRS